MHPRILAWPCLLCLLLSASVNAAVKSEPLVLPAIIITAPAPETVADTTEAAALPVAQATAAEAQP